MPIHTINEKFAQDEWDKLLKAKGVQNWHDFIMGLVK
jgi:hypothetical protein